MKITKPLKERESFFNGWETDKATYKFDCSNCGCEEAITFKQILDAAWGWQERTPEEKRNALAKVFEIDLSDSNISSGMKAVVETECAKCKQATFTYFWFNEYRHSCYDISFRASAIQDTEQGAVE